MIIIRVEDKVKELGLVAELTTHYESEGVQVLQAEDELTLEQAMSIGVTNLTRIRTYIGRIEGRAHKIENILKEISTTLEPIGAKAALDLLEEDQLDDYQSRGMLTDHKEKYRKAKLEQIKKNERSVGGRRTPQGMIEIQINPTSTPPTEE